MSFERGRRIFAVLMAMVLVVVMMSLTGIGTAGACEDLQIKLPAVARGYDAGEDGRYLDGIVTNNTTATVVPNYVKISWAESTKRQDEEWICSGPIKPGEYAAFHLDWPCGVPATWTPVVTGYASPSDADDKPLAVTVDSIGPATVDGSGVRTYSVTVTNNNAVPMSDFNVTGIERDASSTAFVDTLDSCPPDSLDPGESSTFDVTGSSPWGTALKPDVDVSGLEQSNIELTADTTTPDYGSPVTFTLSLTQADGTPALGDRTLKLLVSADGDNWCDYKCVDTNTGTAITLSTPDRPTYYKAVYEGGDDLGYSESDPIQVTPNVLKTTPDLPSSVRARKPFFVRGRMCAGATSGTKPVVLITERRHGSKWVKTASTTANTDSAGRYRKSVKLSSAGTYRIRAYRAGVGYTAYKSLKVRK
ncbi:MAG: hypothetical protein P4L93_04385 [Coriobacteriia bacterium]|nr:hypothetical protein [Coriobacteriia bacterium]